jgi:hypothetical protein
MTEYTKFVTTTAKHLAAGMLIELNEDLYGLDSISREGGAVTLRVSPVEPIFNPLISRSLAKGTEIDIWLPTN